jgi:D-alanyl-D-alanine carboxypeptidase
MRSRSRVRARPGDVNDVRRNLQAVLDAQVGRGNVHSVVAAVRSHDRRIDAVGAAGTADPETPYFLGSVTKMYTAAIAVRLWQRRRLDVDAPITRYLPAALTRAIHVYRGVDRSDRITVRQLISHTSGLPDYEGDRPPGGRSVLDELKAGHDRAIDTVEAMAIVRTLAPRFPPGTPGKAYYSNANFRLLGSVIEAVTGLSMAENFDKEIFSELGLQHTYLFDWTAPRPGRQPATLYLNAAPVSVPKYLSSDVSDGGLVSTATETMTFLRAFFEGRLFDRALLEHMTQWNRIFFPLRYGYGLMDFRLPRLFSLPEFVGHSGTTGAFAFTCPSRSISITGTLNVISPALPYRFAITLVRALSA